MRALETGIFYVNAPTFGGGVVTRLRGTKATGTAPEEGGPPELPSIRWNGVQISDSAAGSSACLIDTTD